MNTSNYVQELLDGKGDDLEFDAMYNKPTKEEYIEIYNKLSQYPNNPIALLNLGMMYENGYGVEEDDNKAIEYYKKAHELGNTDASFRLAHLYVMTDETKKSLEIYKQLMNSDDEHNYTRAVEALEYILDIDSVIKLYDEIDDYKKQISELKEIISCSPGGDEYNKAKKHFEENQIK
jgi:TPR repeat protein